MQDYRRTKGPLGWSKVDNLREGSIGWSKGYKWRVDRLFKGW